MPTLKKEIIAYSTYQMPQPKENDGMHLHQIFSYKSRKPSSSVTSWLILRRGTVQAGGYTQSSWILRTKCQQYGAILEHLVI